LVPQPPHTSTLFPYTTLFRSKTNKEPTYVNATLPSVQAIPAPVPTPAAAPAIAAEPAAPSAPTTDDTSRLITIKSPMIGTFYRSSSPDKPLFVNVGDSVSTGDVICIIEAMKIGRASCRERV